MIFPDQNFTFMAAVRQRVAQHRRIACLLIDEDEQINGDGVEQVRRERRLLEFCRRNDILVWITIFQPEFGNFALGTHPLLRDVAYRPRWFRANNFQGEIYKPRESAFEGTILQQALRQHGVETLLVVGAYYESCIRRTIEDAVNLHICNDVLSCKDLVRLAPDEAGGWPLVTDCYWYMHLGELH